MTTDQIGPRLSVSLMGADPGALRRDIQTAEARGADSLHVDVMDGLFTPRFGIDERTAQWIRSVTELPIDVHLQSHQPSRHLDRWCELGPRSIGLHAEADEALAPLIARLERAGIQAVVYGAPSTSVEVLLATSRTASAWGVLSSDPFVPDSPYQPTTPARIRLLADRLQGERPGGEILVDGSLNADRIRDCRNAGATTFVVGRSFFGGESSAILAALGREAA